MNLYGLTNGDDKRMAQIKMGGYFGGYHSAGFIVAAETIAEARLVARAELIETMVTKDAKYEWSHEVNSYEENLAEGWDPFTWLADIRKISLVKPGIIYYGEGEC